MHKFLLAISLLTAYASALACGIKGSATRTDGSEIDGTARVSTSWNSQTTYPRNGRYELDLGNSACGASVDVYANGQSLGRHSIPSSGNTTVNFVLKGSSDFVVK